MLDSLLAGEIMKRAQMLLKTRGEDALRYSQKVLADTQKADDEEDRIYWNKIVRQVELLVQENSPG